MQEKRLELSWYCYHTDLNRARLPIPPFLRTNVILQPFRNNVNTILKNFSKIFLMFFVFYVKYISWYLPWKLLNHNRNLWRSYENWEMCKRDLCLNRKGINFCVTQREAAIILSSRKFVVLHYSALWGIVGGHCTLKAL